LRLKKVTLLFGLFPNALPKIRAIAASCFLSIVVVLFEGERKPRHRCAGAEGYA